MSCTWHNVISAGQCAWHLMLLACGGTHWLNDILPCAGKHVNNMSCAQYYEKSGDFISHLAKYYLHARKAMTTKTFC